MKFIVPLIVLLTFITCKSSYVPVDIGMGVYRFYYSKEKNIKDELILKSDSTFVLNLDGRKTPTCIGKWQMVDRSSILLECFKDTDLLAPATRGYLSERQRIVKIINEKKIKMPIYNNARRKYIILERIE